MAGVMTLVLLVGGVFFVAYAALFVLLLHIVLALGLHIGLVWRRLKRKRRE